MINLYATKLDSISCIAVGITNKNETIFFSENTHSLNDETTGLLKELFF